MKLNDSLKSIIMNVTPTIPVPIQQKKTPHYLSTMQNYHDFVTRFNAEKPFPEKVRNGIKHTGEHLYRIWMITYQSKKTEDFSFTTSLKSLSTRTEKSERTIIRHLIELLYAGLIVKKRYSKRGLFTIEVNPKVVLFMDLNTKKVIHNSD